MNEEYSNYLDYLITQSSLKHRAWCTDVVYYERPRNAEKYNSLLKHGEKYPGLSKPDKQVGNLGFWYLWKDIKILTFEEWKQKKENA